MAGLQERGGFGGEVVGNAFWASFVGLVDVDALDGAAEGGGVLGRGGATDGVVED